MSVQDDKAAGQDDDQQVTEKDQQTTGQDGDQQLTEKPEPDEEQKEKAAEMMTAYQDRPTLVLPGTGGMVSGTAVNDWLDEDGNPKQESPDDVGKNDKGSSDDKRSDAKQPDDKGSDEKAKKEQIEKDKAWNEKLREAAAQENKGEKAK